MATMRMNVFQYAAREEAAFRAQAQEIGYKQQTTFYNDLSIAEFCEKYMQDRNAIQHTINNCIKSWLSDIKYITELALCLNWKVWRWYESDIRLAKLYQDAYDKLYDKVCEKYKNKDKELSYFFRTLD